MLSRPVNPDRERARAWQYQEGRCRGQNYRPLHCRKLPGREDETHGDATGVPVVLNGIERDEIVVRGSSVVGEENSPEFP